MCSSRSFSRTNNFCTLTLFDDTNLQNYFEITNKLLNLYKINYLTMEKEKRKYNQSTIEEKKKHAIQLAKLRVRMDAIGMKRYAKEFPEYDSYHIGNVMTGKVLDFEFLVVLENKIKAIEKLYR